MGEAGEVGHAAVDEDRRAGHVAGMLYAISTAGSILGTFLPVLVLLPWLGTTLTFIVSGALLLIYSAVGILATGQHIKERF